MTAAPAFGVSGTATTGYVPTVQSDGSIAWAAVPSGAVSSVFTRTGAVVAGNADYLAVKTGGLTGATAAVRYVGGTTSGAPASGTFAVGDFVNDQLGNVFVCVTAGTPGTWTNATASASQLAATAIGVKYENWPATLAGNVNAPVSQTVYGTVIGAHAGAIITGIKLRLNVAAAGTAPTTARFGLADSTGKILVSSNNLNAASSWVGGAASFPFTAPYTILADGGFIPCFVVNGVWGSTQPTLLNIANSGATPEIADGSNPPLNIGWVTQTDLPSVGASLTLTQQSTRTHYMALY